MVMTDPALELTAPVADPLIPSTFDEILHVADYLSLGHWALVAFEKMGGGSITDIWGTAFAGDWEEVSKAADAMAKLGAFCQSAATGMRQELETLNAKWDGQAATSAMNYFRTLITELESQKDNFDAIAEQYQQAAVGIKGLADTIGGLIELLFDLVIAAGIELAAAAASSWTIIGPVLAGSALAATVLKGIKTINEIASAWGTAVTFADGFLGLLLPWITQIENFETVALPGAYDHPRV